ncbi:conserved hypothetical protein [Synechococcus sp. CC9902]|uniref:hypothetical protein n=1 Tax=Synechococcus sp. (strain CC9902) TaxID=316279 RepID=UPI00005D44DC|nr:conserved hypothetical protein [Synechococcus sp. CC9902]
MALVTALCVGVLPIQAPGRAATEPQASGSFAQRLQTALNKGSEQDLGAVVAPELLPTLASRYKAFRNDFPGLAWSVRPAPPLVDGRSTFLVTVNGATTAQGVSYQLQSEERLAIRTEAGRLVAQDVISQESLLRSGKRPLQVTMGIPDVVLTGSRYDIDLIVEEPLGQAMLAGGVIELTDQQLATLSRPNLQLAPLGGGGLFKSVQAPQRPGSQTWALMLVHPDGVVTATKRVQIVSNFNDQAQI